MSQREVVGLENNGAPIVSMRGLLSEMPDKAVSAMLGGSRGVGKTWLAMRTLMEVPGSLFIATEENRKVLDARLRYLVGKFGGTSFEVVEASGIAALEDHLATWSTGVICLDGISGLRPKAVEDLLGHHQEFGRARLLCTHHRWPGKSRHWADVHFLLEEHELIEGKNRFHAGGRRFAFDVRRVAEGEVRHAE